MKILLSLLLVSFSAVASPELEVAIRRKDYEHVKKLLALEDWKSDVKGTLDALAKFGDEKTLLLFNPASANFPGKRFMHLLGRSQNKELLTAFYKHATPDVKGLGLYYFIGKMSASELELFKDLTKKDITPSNHLALIHETCEAKVDRHRKLELLKKMGFTFKEKGRSESTALHYFVTNDGTNLDCIDVYLKHGVSINEVEKSGRTALHMSHDFKTYDYLVARGAKTDIEDNRGHLPERREVPKEIIKERKSSGKGLFDIEF